MYLYMHDIVDRYIVNKKKSVSTARKRDTQVRRAM